MGWGRPQIQGRALADIIVGDALELMDREAESLPGPAKDHKIFYRMLRELGIFGDQAPGRLQAFRTAGQLTPGELVDRYQLRCRPVRDLLVDYLSERQPAIDYTSLKNLAYYLAQRFWADLEQHHPGIDSLHLASDVAAAWKQRQRIKPQTITSAAGQKSVVTNAAALFRDRRADPDAVSDHLPGQREDLGGRSGHREATRSGRGGGSGVLGLGRRGSTAPDRRPRRGAPGVATTVPFGPTMTGPNSSRPSHPGDKPPQPGSSIGCPAPENWSPSCRSSRRRPIPSDSYLLTELNH